MTVEIGILGPIVATRDGEVVDVRGDRQRTLLALLALTPGQARPMDRIIDAMWAEDELPADPRPAIHTCASRVRGIVGDEVIVSTGGAYVLAVSPLAVDAHRFERLVDRSTETNRTLHERIDMLREALALWRGPALDGLADREWSRPDAIRLDERRAFAEDLLAEALLEAGRADESVASLEAAASRQPLRERTHQLLMTALHAAGRQAEALRVFQSYRRRLATDLGLDPGESIVELDRRIADGDGGVDVAPRGLPTARGYRLLERIGDGAFAVVYRGLQPAVGREVAIKVVREELANRPEFIRRFEAEAHLVARLEHPHIVPLYDYWREPSSAWLVMRLFRGGTLEDRVATGTMPLVDVVKIATQIGGALEAAHRAGVVHRDVKPANVFLDPEGNAFLGDFGIAYADAVPHVALDSLSVGSPAYASPEQLRREPVGPPADIHGLAITVYECLAGRSPFGDAPNEAELLRRQLNDPLPDLRMARPDLPQAVDAVLRRATAKAPLDRHETVTEFVAELVAAASGTMTINHARRSSVMPDSSVIRNPYKGLLAFQEADAADFFGRVRLVDRLVEQMSRSSADARFIALVGPSGAGKSSVVRAGLLPALRAGRVPSSDTWFVTAMMPGADPFEELEAALARVAGTSVGGLAELMAADRRGIGRAVKQILPDETSELVLVIDQFEEIFTLCPDAAVRHRFAAGLVAAISEVRSRLRVVSTLRADFYDRPLRVPELAAVVEQGTVVLAPLAADELELAITEPALRAGSRFEPGLVARIVADVVDQPGALPLLQYALTELFERREANVMTMAAYDELGGLTGALGRRAEEIHDGFGEPEREVARRLFTRLVAPGEGTADTRRRVLRSELGADAAVDRVIESFGAARLLAFDHDPVTREPTVEVAHEALLREWSRLRGWLDDDRDGLRVHRHLTLAAAGWEASGRDAGELYRGGRLETASSWAREHDGDLNERERAFLESSECARAAALAADARDRARLRRLLIAVACVAVLALITSVVAVRARRRAEENERAAASAATEADTQRAEADMQRVAAAGQRDAADIARERAEAAELDAEDTLRHAETERMAALAPDLADNDLSLALLLAAEARLREESPETMGSLLDTLRAAGDVVRLAPNGTALPATVVEAIAGDRVVTVYVPDHVVVRDVQTMEVLQDFIVSDPQPIQPPLKWKTPAIGNDVIVWIGSAHGLVIDLASGEEQTLPGPPPSGVGIDRATGRLAVVDEAGGLTMYDSPSDPTPRWTQAGDGARTVGDALDAGLIASGGGQPDPSTALRSFVEFSLDGSSLFVTRGWGVRQYRTVDGALIGDWPRTTPLATEGQVLEMIDDTHLAVATYVDVALLDIATGTYASVIDSGHEDYVIGEVYNTPVRVGGGRLVVPTTSGDFRLVERNGERTNVKGRVGLGGAATLLEAGTLLIAGNTGFAEYSIDGRSLLRDVLPGTEWANNVWAARDGGQVSVAHRPPGFSSISFDRAQEWTCDTGGRECVLIDDIAADPANPSETPVTYWADPLADVLVEWTPGQASIFELDGTLLGRVPGIPSPGQAFVPESRDWVAVLDLGPRHLDVWSLPDGERILEVEFDGIFRLMAGPPDGRVLLFPDPFLGDVQVIDTSTWTIVTGATDLVDDGIVEVLPADQVDEGTGLAVAAAFDQQGEQLATILPSGAVTLRDGDSFELRSELGGDGCCLAAAAFSEDGRLLLVAIGTTVQLWDVETGRPIGSPIHASWSGVVPTPGETPIIGDVVPGQGVTIWRYEVDTWADLACQAAGRNMTEEEWDLYGPAGEPYHATCPQWPLPLDRPAETTA